MVRSVGLSLSPLFVGYLLANPENSVLFGAPFVISGALKCLYDILLYISFRLSKHESTTTNDTIKPAVQSTSYQAVPTTEIKPINK